MRDRAARVRAFLLERQLSGELYDVAAELREATRSLEIRARVLPLSSPYRDVQADAWLELEAIDRELQDIPEAAEKIALEAELAVTFVVAAKRSIAQALRDARGSTSLRAVATQAGVSASYLNELETGKSVPSMVVAVKIGGAVGLDLPSLVESLLAKQAGLRERAKKRETARRGPLRLPAQLAPRQRERLEAAAAHLLRDEELLNVVEVLIALGADGQRALRQIADILLRATGGGTPIRHDET